MVDIWQLDKISDNNQQTWPEGTMEGNQINDAGRDDQSLMARWYADWNGTLVSAGTGSAYTVTSNTNRTSYGNDLVLAIRIHTDSLDNPTLNVSALGARPWLKNGGDQIQAGDLREDMLVVASYRDGSFYTMSSTYQGSAASKDVGTADSEIPDNATLKATAREYTGQQTFTEATLADAASIVWDLDTAQVAKVTLAGNRTLDNPTNLKAGGTYILRVVQDAIGSRTLAYGSAYRFPGGTAPTLSTDPNAVDYLTFVSDGTNMDGVAQLDFK